MTNPTRKPTRLKNHDYSAPGAYFITVCTHARRCILSDTAPSPVDSVGAGVLDGPRVVLSDIGRIVEETILSIDQQYPNISMDKYVIMPNHLHLLIQLHAPGSSGTPTPTNETIPALISTLKRLTNRKTGEKLWQRSYYDHVIRNETDYREIWQYIGANPARWAEDRFHPQA